MTFCNNYRYRGPLITGSPALIDLMHLDQMILQRIFFSFLCSITLNCNSRSKLFQRKIRLSEFVFANFRKLTRGLNQISYVYQIFCRRETSKECFVLKSNLFSIGFAYNWFTVQMKKQLCETISLI